MELQDLLNQIENSAESVQFNDVIAVIDANYEFTPTAFTNGGTANEAGQNNGSCKIFAFGKLNNLSEAATLACFGDFYRKDVLEHPDAEDHQNIRNFMKSGWQGVEFEGNALAGK